MTILPPFLRDFKGRLHAGVICKLHVMLVSESYSFATQLGTREQISVSENERKGIYIRRKERSASVLQDAKINYFLHFQVRC